MEIEIFYKGELKGEVVDGSIKFIGLDLNGYLDEALNNIVQEENEEGDILFVSIPAPLEQKLFYMENILGFELKKKENKEQKADDTLGLYYIVYKFIKSKEQEIKNILDSQGLDQNITNKMNVVFSTDELKESCEKYIRKNFIGGAEVSEDIINKIRPYNYIPDNDAINYISNYTFDNIKGVTDDIVADLRQQFQMAYMNGEGTKKINERLRNIFDVEARVKTISRTESARAYHFGRLNSFKQSGVPAKKWLMMTDDNRTSDISKALNQKYGSEEQAIPLDDNFKVSVKVGKKIINIDQPCGPFHPNERDELIIVPILD